MDQVRIKTSVYKLGKTPMAVKPFGTLDFTKDNQYFYQ